MSDEQEIRLEDMDHEELLGRMEGGLFGLLDSDEEYAELFRVAAALGIKQFVAERMSGKPREDLLELFSDGEQVIHDYIQFAYDKGLLEKVEGEEQE